MEPDETLGSLLKSSGRKVNRVKKWSNDLQFRLGFTYGDAGYMSGGGFYIGASNCNLYNVNDTFSIGFAESLGFITGGFMDISFIVGPAVGINVKDIVKFQFSPGLAMGIWDFWDDGDCYAFSDPFVWFSLDIAAKFLPSKFVSPVAGFRYKVYAVDLTTGVSLNFGKR